MPSGRGAARLVAAALTVLMGCAVFPSGPPEYRTWKALTEELRELEFSRFSSPGYRWIEQHEIAGILREDLERSLEPEFVTAYEAAFKALGFLPPKIDLLDSMLALQQDQVVGFYSPGEDTMYVRSDLPPGLDELQPIVVHELVHALQARHFPRVMDLMRGLRHNDDLVSALAAAVEGDASFTMLGVPDSGIALRRDLQSAYTAREVVLIDLEHPSGVLGDAPRLLQRSILFPYAHGVVVAGRRYAKAQNAGLDALLRDPPLATARVYDPEASAPVEFLRLPEDALREAAVADGCRLGHHNAAGALVVRVLFDEHLPGADRARVEDLLRAWSGDRFVHVACGDRSEFAWVSRWADPAHARDFAELYDQAAPAIRDSAGLSATPKAHATGRTVVVTTPGLAALVDTLRDRTEVRAYASLDAWLADDCFPESPCPR